MRQKQHTPPTILLVEPDDQVRPILKLNLCRRGYRVIVALDEEDALERTRSGGERPDVILLDQFGQSIDEFINIGRHIRQGAGLPVSRPIVVMAERYGVDLEGQDIKVDESEYVSYLEDGQQLIDLLHRLCPFY